MRPLLAVASEVYPLIKTGGLADVAGALPAALAAEGWATRTLIPGYPAVLRKLAEVAVEVVWETPSLFGGPARLLAAGVSGLQLLVIEAPHLYDRAGGPYAGPDGDWPDNAQRFAALARVAERIGRGALGGWVPEVVHGHDWQAGLMPAYFHYGEGHRPGTVMTIHNLAFQGQFPPSLLAELELPPHAWSVEGVEYYGSLGFLKAGLLLADRVTTVSPSYAAEICTPEGGMGMDGLLRARGGALEGILNGIDVTVWDPAADPHLPVGFDVDRLGARGENKVALQSRLGLRPQAGAPVVGIVSRLTWQKGMDLVLEALPRFVAHGMQLAVLGAGDRGLEDGFGAAARQWPGQVGLFLGYDEGLAHLVQGGSDALIVPSRFEPCGLTQLCAQRYGAIPVVSRVGGLADTVVDANEIALSSSAATGVVFAPTTRVALDAAIDRLARLWEDRQAWAQTQRNGMTASLGWERPARRYAALYRAIAA